MILEVLLAAASAGVLVVLIAWGLTAQLQRLVTEERPGACLGCGFEHNCRRDGCAVLRQVSRIVAATGKRGTTS